MTRTSLKRFEVIQPARARRGKARQATARELDSIHRSQAAGRWATVRELDARLQVDEGEGAADGAQDIV